jgi:hypothetical protein
VVLSSAHPPRRTASVINDCTVAPAGKRAENVGMRKKWSATFDGGMLNEEIGLLNNNLDGLRAVFCINITIIHSGRKTSKVELNVMTTHILNLIQMVFHEQAV